MSPIQRSHPTRFNQVLKQHIDFLSSSTTFLVTGMHPEVLSFPVSQQQSPNPITILSLIQSPYLDDGSAITLFDEVPDPDKPGHWMGAAPTNAYQPAISHLYQVIQNPCIQLPIYEYHLTNTPGYQNGIDYSSFPTPPITQGQPIPPSALPPATKAMTNLPSQRIPWPNNNLPPTQVAIPIPPSLPEPIWDTMSHPPEADPNKWNHSFKRPDETVDHDSPHHACQPSDWHQTDQPPADTSEWIASNRAPTRPIQPTAAPLPRLLGGWSQPHTNVDPWDTSVQQQVNRNPETPSVQPPPDSIPPPRATNAPDITLPPNQSVPQMPRPQQPDAIPLPPGPETRNQPATRSTETLVHPSRTDRVSR